MSVLYDKYYQSENLFGAPYPELVEFFSKSKGQGRVLDVGCGQGRDAIAIAELGFEVLGIDNSQIGVEQMLSNARIRGLKVEGLVDDIFKYTGYGDFDFILFDSMFHFLKKDVQRESALLKKVMEDMRLNSTLVVCIQDSGNKVETLRKTIDSSGSMDYRADIEFIYAYRDEESNHESTSDYRLIAAEKKFMDVKR